MKKKIIIIVLIVLIIAGITLAIILNKNNKKEYGLIHITFNELQEKVKNKDSFILVITRTDCSHCAEYKPVLTEVLNKYKIAAYQLDTDPDILSDEEIAKLKDIASISGTPTTIFIENGEEKTTANRIVGTASASKIEKRLKSTGYIK